MSTNIQSLTTLVLKRTHRFPTHYEVEEKTVSVVASEAIARQLDIALISEGFKASSELIRYISSLKPVYARESSSEIINSIQEIKGNHVNHNVYFKDFPDNVPDTIEFWSELISKTYGSREEAPTLINLLALDGYGEYLHTYQEMVNAHDEFISDGSEKFTIINLGKSLESESLELYHSLAGSKVPANGDDLELLKRLADVCIDYEQPDKIPVRENRAIINSVRVEFGVPILVDTVTDVLRLAAYMSGSDVTLNTKPYFKAFPNKTRRILLQGLDDVVSESPAKLGDVHKNKESFKRLFYRLNTNKKYPNAYRVLQCAVNGDNTSFEAKLEKAFGSNDIDEAVKLLKSNPGLFVKSLNRLLLHAKIKDVSKITEAFSESVGNVSTPTLIGLRQYLYNRKSEKSHRIFINKKGTGKVVEDNQPVLGKEVLAPINDIIDNEIISRLPESTYVISRDIIDVALPLSNKHTADGFGVLPRGSTDTVNNEVLRFFTYWKQNSAKTDYDLSTVLLDENLDRIGQLSYTNLNEVGGVHSGDITSAPKGASEFIDIELNKVEAKYIIPQVNVYAGEGFNEVEESFFGYMGRSLAQKGKPFEPLTVKTKSELRGENRVALPLMFMNVDGVWRVKWLNTFIKGYGWANRTENNSLTTSSIVGSIIETEYLTVGYITDLIIKSGNVVYFEDELDGREDFEKRIESPSETIYISKETPEYINKTDTKSINLKNLHELLF